MKKRIANAVLAASILLIAGVVIYGLLSDKDGQDAHRENSFSKEEEDFYYIDEHQLVDFSEVIVEQFRKESRLVVSSVDASVSVSFKETGIFDVDILNKTQKVTYNGTGRFYVDLSLLGRHSIRLDNDRSTVTIEIPHTELAEIEIDPDRFQFAEAEKGFLAFGELKFTAEEYNDLQIECKDRLQDAIDTKENRTAADRRAVEEMKKIYEPIVKAVDDGYSVEIVFMEE